MLPVTQLIDLSNQLVRCCLISILIKISLQKKSPLYQIYQHSIPARSQTSERPPSETLREKFESAFHKRTYDKDVHILSFLEYSFMNEIYIKPFMCNYFNFSNSILQPLS